MNKKLLGLFFSGIAFLGLFFFVGAFRKGFGGIGAEELFLGICGLGFLFISCYVGRFVFSPRVVVEKDYFLISDFYRRRKFAYEEILALAEFTRMMPIRFNQNRCLRVPVLAIRLRSGKLIQFALPASQNNRACLDALASASGLSIESLGIDPPHIREWRRETQ